MQENLTITAGTVLTVKAATAALKGLGSAFADLGSSIREAFAVRGYQDYLQTVKRFGKALADQLLVLQMSFGRLKVAIAQAFAPIVQTVVPYINQAINAITRFLGMAAQVIAAVMVGVTGNSALAHSAEQAADAENSLKTAATGAGKAVRRSLMGFDEVNRLNAPAGGGGGSAITPGGITVSPQAQAIADKLLAALARIRELLAPVLEGLSRLVSVLGSHLTWLWENILSPFVLWLGEALAPALSGWFAAGLDLVSAALEPLLTGLQSLWTALQPLAAFIGETIIMRLNSWQAAFQTLADSIGLNGSSITGVFHYIGQMLSTLWAGMEPVFWTIRQVASEVFGGLSTVAAQATGYVISTLGGLSDYLSGVFAGQWQQSWLGMQEFLRSTINTVLSFFNSMAAGAVSAINGVIRGANRLSFSIPSWVPGVGGKSFGLNLSTVTAPQVPYLAQGAVLPANRPFLAVVGDQRKGTNIEAPLDTIRQAVALELNAGIQAMVAEQRLTRRAVAEIRVGDSTIGRAAQRYSDGLLAITGGV